MKLPQFALDKIKAHKPFDVQPSPERPECYDTCFAHCSRCDFRTDPKQGQYAVCTIDGRDCVTAAKSGVCPLKMFEQPLGNKKRNRKGRYIALFREAIALLPSKPTYEGSGVCIVGMGRYFDSAYITIRVLRHLGYEGKIELWALNAAEVYNWHLKALEGLEVKIVNAEDVLKEYPAVIRHPWTLKPYAILHSGYGYNENWKDCLYLDADAYPCRSDFLSLFDSDEYKAKGAIYFPDDAGYDLRPEQWAAFGLEYKDEPGFESGEIYVDKDRNHRELHTALLLCEHQDYTFGVVHGDKETFHLAHRLLGTDYSQPSKRWVGFPALPCMIQHDFKGQPLFVHRSVSKFHLAGTIGSEYFNSTGQVGDKRNDLIPLESFCWKALEDLRQIRGKFVAVVQIEAAGDILVLLPALKYLARDKTVSLVVNEKYASIASGHEWLNVIPFKGKAQEYKKAMLLAESGGVPRLAQVGYVKDPRVSGSWSTDIWIRSGVPIDLYDVLPLELDNRNSVAEQALIDKYIEGDRPLILLNTIGNSSPYKFGDGLRQTLAKEFGDYFQILDLAFVKAKRIIDLMGLYDRACLVISIDTSTLHLTNANRVPTIALVRDPDDTDTWGQSARRSHWIERLTYSDSSNAMAIVAAIDKLFHIPGRAAKPIATVAAVAPKESGCGCKRKKAA